MSLDEKQDNGKPETGLLSDIEILSRLVEDGDSCIFVSPLTDPLEQVGPSSLDLRLGTELSLTRIMRSTHIDLCASRDDIEKQTRQYYQKWKIGANDFFVLHPNEFALASTLEFLRLPADIAARLEGRSSLGRLGLQVHATAGFVDPGFAGTLTFELINSGRLPVKLMPGIRLGQICFFRVHNVQADYLRKTSSKYGNKLGVELTKIHLDKEFNKKAH